MHPLRSAWRLLLLCLALPPRPAQAQSTVPVLMLSDIHFDPFQDPAKLPQLRAVPIDRWPVILSAPPTPTQAADLQALQTACNSRALDTAWPLLQASLAAAHDAESRPLFLTLSGDLLAHEFPCRFTTLAPDATPQELAAFSAKTVSFVLAQFRAAFPRSPVYAALGNNDSGCADYRETPADTFLKTTTGTLATPVPESTSAEGDYSVLLPAPMAHTRLIVLQDVFASRQFATCANTSDRTPERAQIDWLRTQLAAARARNEHAWVMAHIPPGVDVFTSFHRFVLQPAALCSATPTPFLADTTLPDALLDYADIVRLAVFGHTHMDEFRVLHRPSESPDSSLSSRPERTGIPGEPRRSGETGTGVSSTVTAAIPAKLTPSVTPFFGNHPAFLVAAVDPRTAILKDWRTVVSPAPEGSTPPWAEAYRFTSAYALPDFSAASALKLAGVFTADPTGQSPQSTAFRQHFYPGDLGLYALGLAQIWPAYACAVREDRPSAVHNCICAAREQP